MPRLTITLSAETLRALKNAAGRREKTICELVEESLDLAGLKTMERAADLVAKVRRRAALTEARALDLAVRETRAVRRR